MLDASQAVVAAYRYDPFGVLLTQTGSLTQPYMFSTKRYDAQTGLIHYEFRDYLPALARWTTRDPLGEAGGMNLYAFVGNNPVNWVDPRGFMTQELVWRPVFEGIKVKIPSLAGYLTGVSTNTLVSGVLGGFGGVIMNMIFPTPVGEGSDVIPPPIIPIASCNELDKPYEIPSPDTWTETIEVPKPIPKYDGGNDICVQACLLCHGKLPLWKKLPACIMCYTFCLGRGIGTGGGPWLSAE